MGGVKESYLQEQESQHLYLARALGISWKELASLDFQIHTNMSKEGILYGYVIEFSEKNDVKLLNKISGLEGGSNVQLPPWVFDRTEEEEYELEAINDNKEYKENFMTSIFNIERLNEIYIEDESLKEALLQQLFIGVISALETYLSDAFINKALESKWYLQRFVESHPEFKKQKIQLSELYSMSVTIKEKAKSVMMGTIYHKLPVVKEMYEATFYIDFPDITVMQKYIAQRHDLVHRNGKTTEGKRLRINDRKIETLIASAVHFVEKVSAAIDDEIPF